MMSTNKILLILYIGANLMSLVDGYDQRGRALNNVQIRTLKLNADQIKKMNAMRRICGIGDTQVFAAKHVVFPGYLVGCITGYYLETPFNKNVSIQ